MLNMGGLFKAGKEYCDQKGILFEDFVKVCIHEDIDGIEPTEFNNEYYLELLKILSK